MVRTIVICNGKRSGAANGAASRYVTVRGRIGAGGHDTLAAKLQRVEPTTLELRPSHPDADGSWTASFQLVDAVAHGANAALSWQLRLPGGREMSGVGRSVRSMSTSSTEPLVPLWTQACVALVPSRLALEGRARERFVLVEWLLGAVYTFGVEWAQWREHGATERALEWMASAWRDVGHDMGQVFPRVAQLVFPNDSVSCLDLLRYHWFRNTLQKCIWELTPLHGSAAGRLAGVPLSAVCELVPYLLQYPDGLRPGITCRLVGDVESSLALLPVVNHVAVGSGLVEAIVRLAECMAAFAPPSDQRPFELTIDVSTTDPCEIVLRSNGVARPWNDLETRRWFASPEGRALDAITTAIGLSTIWADDTTCFRLTIPPHWLATADFSR